MLDAACPGSWIMDAFTVKFRDSFDFGTSIVIRIDPVKSLPASHGYISRQYGLVGPEGPMRDARLGRTGELNSATASRGSPSDRLGAV